MKSPFKALFRRGPGRIRRILLSMGVLVLPLGAIGGAQLAGVGVASATTSCGLAQEQDWAWLYADNYTQYAFADYNHSWFPMQTATQTPANQDYAKWAICWTVTGDPNGPGWDYGYAFIDNLGTDVNYGQPWLGEGYQNEQQATATGPGPSEEYQFQCLGGNRLFELQSMYAINQQDSGSNIAFESSYGTSPYGPISNVEVMIPYNANSPDDDIFQFSTGLFCS